MTIKTITKTYQGKDYRFTKTFNGYKVSQGGIFWYQNTASVREAKRRSNN